MSIDKILLLSLGGSFGIAVFVWLIIYLGFVKNSTPKEAAIVFVKIMAAIFVLIIFYEIHMIERGGS